MQQSWIKALIALLLLAGARAQTTQGMISGRVVDSRTGRGVDGASVTYTARFAGLGGKTLTDSKGYFTLPLLSPGTYRLEVEKNQDYQPQQVDQVELAVAGRLDFNFQLRPKHDVWEAGRFRSVIFPADDAVLTFYGPDVDPSRFGSFASAEAANSVLDSSLSTVIDQQIISNLPLNGHDLYTLLATQPGVTADTTTARGLGLAVTGQRPSASNFLLDGVENNNYVVTGPLTTIAPEAVQEYRISTSNYSAEYGRTSGFIANAITRSARTHWHGLIYDYLKLGAFNANGFQENANGFPRPPLKEVEPGMVLGGPVIGNRLFVSGTFEWDGYRSKQDPQIITLPSTSFLALTAPNSTARMLLQRYAPMRVVADTPLTEAIVRPPMAENRVLATARSDYLRGNGSQRFLLRAVSSRDTQPDFGWTPYPDFITPLVENTLGAAGAWLWTPNPRFTNETRASVTLDETYFNRPHPDVPVMAAGDGTALPGSPEPYSYLSHGRSVELAENQLWILGRHIIKFGGGVLARSINGYITPGQSGYFGFSSGLAFAQDNPDAFYIARLRQAPSTNVTPDYDRNYQYTQYFGFVQDSFKVSPRLGLNLGLRYENFGAPKNVGSTKDAEVQPGSGDNLGQRIINGQMVYPAAGDEQIYHQDNHAFAVRAGFAYDLFGRGKTVIRGGYGIFYDRPFDNLWTTLTINNLVLAAPASATQTIPFVLPASQAAASIPLQPNPNFPQLTLFQPGLRDAYAQNAFLSVQQRIAGAFTMQLNGVTSLGRDLITTDLLNRPHSVPGANVFQNPQGKFQPSWPLIDYRGNQGISDYYGLEILARYRTPRAQFQASYTLSHSIDNQSEPLAGEFFNFNFTSPASQPSAAFTRQFDSQADRASSDFDQRHNLVMYGVWELPPAVTGAKGAALFRDWILGGLAAFRSGFPYSPIEPDQIGSGAYYINNRPNLVPNADPILNTPAVGGVQILNPGAFSMTGGAASNLGRNAFRGPGLYSADVSLSRTIHWRRLGDAGRVVVRADAFNVLNHLNLNNPETSLNPQPPSVFGAALYGRQGFDPGFPGLIPLNENPRQIQMMLRVEF